MHFGGVKASGYGRFGDNWGIDEFTELRWITGLEKPPHYPRSERPERPYEGFDGPADSPIHASRFRL
jgi:hypothetical protein